MTRKFFAALTTFLAVPSGLAGVQSTVPPVQNAVQETRAATTLSRDVSSLGGGVEPAWVGWRVPMVTGDRDLCSTRSDDTRYSRGAILEDSSTAGQPRGFGPPPRPVALEAGSELVVLVRTVAGAVERVRTVTGDCPLDAGGRRLTWLTGVTPAASVSYLRTLTTLTSIDTAARYHIAEAALGAIALHQDASGYTTLTETLGRQDDGRLRDLAAQWLARARGAEGFAYLTGALRTATDPALRRTLALAIGQTRESGTPAALLALARTDTDDKVRAEALAWYAQLGSGSVVTDVLGIIERDTNTQVRSRGIAGLLRRPSRDALPTLLSLARTTTDLELRKELVRSLGRSDDPRAIALMEELVKR